MDAKGYRPKPPDEIRRNMAAIRSTDNKVETALRKRLHAAGLRYRKYARQLPGRPDIVFPTERIAVFVDGDYWHCRTLVEQGLEALKERLRTGNREYWLDKCQRRVRRDREITAALEAANWLVLRFWESDVKRDLGTVVDQVASAVYARRQATQRK